MTAILHKQVMYRRWLAGEFGNTPRAWANVVQMLSSGYRGECTIRTAQHAGGKTLYRVPAHEAALRAAPLAEPRFNESMPDDLLILQGEVMATETGLVLAYSRAPGLKMNEARKGFLTATALHAKFVLQQALWPADYDDLFDLLDRYPEHVVEFSTYDRSVGRIPHRNTVVWEVRRY